MGELVMCAVEKARAAAEDWAARDIQSRCGVLLRLRDLLAENADSLATAVAREIGKPEQEAWGADVLPCLSALQWLARNAPKVLRERKIAGSRAVQCADSLGVVGVIGTWNYPLFLNLAPIAWALAAGNTIVWKPSELAGDSARMLFGLFEKAGLPVFPVVGGAEAGRELCAAGCDKIAFTGGGATGRKILASLAEFGTPSVMELSGNDAMLVCADAEVRLAARSAVWGRVCNAGQSCVAPQRIYVHTAIYDEFLASCHNEIEALRAGTDYGPMRTEAVRIRAHGLVLDALTRGAKLHIGGFCLPEPVGAYYAPTLLSDCDDAMPVMAEDFFGPVLPVCRIADEAEGVRRANASAMGLGASVWSRDGRKANALARSLRVGTVTLNEILLDAADPALPFGGRGASGFGKQRGVAGLDEFVTWKTIAAHGTRGTRRHLFPYRAATLPILRGIAAMQAAHGLKAKWSAARTLGQAAMQWENTKKIEDRK